MKKNHDYLFKLQLIGDCGVGKTSLLRRFSRNIFEQGYMETIGVDLFIQYFQSKGRTVKLQIWDTSSKDSHRHSFYTRSASDKGLDGILLVYDITNKQTFKNIQTWYAEAEQYLNNSTILMLLGNKSDLEEKRQVTFQEGLALAHSLDIKFIQTSAKDAVNVEKVFFTIGISMKRAVSKKQKE